MALLHSNFKAGLLDADPGIGGTTLSSPGFEFLPVVDSPDLLWLVLDPDAVNGAPETVLVTAHTASATTVTVIRGQQGDTARAHPVNTEWIHSLTKGEADVLPTTLLTTEGDLVVASGVNAVERLPVGADGTFPVADSTSPTGGIAYKGGMVKIEEQLATTATLTFSSIPQDFDHLRIEARPRHENGSGGATFRTLAIQFNGDATANYDTVFAFADGTGAPANSATDNTANPAISTVGVRPGTLIIDIPEYSTGDNFKTAHAVGSARQAQTVAGTRNILGADVMWQNAAAITSVTLFILSGAGDVFDSVVFSLYGLG